MTRDNLRPDLGLQRADHEKRIRALERRQLPLAKPRVEAGDIIGIWIAGGGVDAAFSGSIGSPVHVFSFSFLLPAPCTVVATLTGSVRLNTGSGPWTGYMETTIDGGGMQPGRCTWQQATAAADDLIPVTMLQAAELEDGSHTVEIIGYGSPETVLHGLDAHLLGLLGPTTDITLSCD